MPTLPFESMMKVVEVALAVEVERRRRGVAERERPSRERRAVGVVEAPRPKLPPWVKMRAVEVAVPTFLLENPAKVESVVKSTQNPKPGSGSPLQLIVTEYGPVEQAGAETVG